LKPLFSTLACLLIALAFSACGKPASTVASNSSSTPSAAQARQAIIHALLALNTQPNRLDVTTVDSAGISHPSVIEFLPPDKKHITAEGTDLIIAGGKVYLQSSSSAPWQEMEVPASTYLGNPPVTEEAMGKYVENSEFLRAEVLNGRSMFVFHYSSSSVSNGVTLHSQVDLWVDPVDGLPYKMITEGETLKVSLNPSTGQNEASAEKALSTCLISFPAHLTIESPLP